MSLGKGFVAVSPSNSTDIARDAAGEFPGALYVGVAGDVSVVGADGNTAVFQNAPAGTILPIRARRVNSTDTTASGLIGIYV